MQFKLCGFSFRSHDEARERLEEKARVLAAFYGGELGVEERRRKFLELNEQAQAEEYDVVITEEVLRRVDEENVITRNRYGVDVLNSADTCFLDVDEWRPSAWGRFLRIFGIGKSDEELLLDAVRELCSEDITYGVRVYRTTRGWRLIAVADGLSPDSPRMAAFCERLRVDPLYREMCRKQGCWRARLTPKPYRLGMPRTYPCARVAGQAGPDAAEWLALYREKSAHTAVCRLVDVFGAPVKGHIVELHDELTGAYSPDMILG